jgi:hypothetical protein
LGNEPLTRHGGLLTGPFIVDVMTEREAEIRVKDRIIPIRLDYGSWQWHCAAELAEADFPIPVHAEGKRYLLYSDGTFREVEK